MKIIQNWNFMNFGHCEINITYNTDFLKKQNKQTTYHIACDTIDTDVKKYKTK